ncbi:MAG: permease-like cell division protein FtsX [Patescibacteria group bacterium]|jgi:cell division transport system permease protein
MWHTTKRAFLFAGQNFIRNFWLSLVTLLIMVLTLFMITTLAGVQLVSTEAIRSVENQVDVTVYFEPETPESVVFDVQEGLLADSRVEGVRFVSRTEALAEFREKNQDNPLLLDAIEALETNPLGPTLVVKAVQLADYAEILKALETEDVSRFIQDEGRDFEETALVVERLSGITDRLRQIGLIVSSVFVLIAMMMTVNTIRIAIYTHREEIAIMKLVGATNGFIRAPFIIESLYYAVLGAIITTLLFLPMIGLVDAWLGGFFAGYELGVVELLQNNLLWFFLGQLAFAVFLSALSAAIAVGRYLRV